MTNRIPDHREDSVGAFGVDRSSTTRLTRHEGGYAAQGPGFYVWDRDVAEVIRVAEALQAGCSVGSRSARFMLIEHNEPLAG